MLGVKGQYKFQFSIGDLKDFIAESNFVSFKLEEKAGNLLPIFELSFKFTDDSIISRLNEGNVLKVTFGRDFGDRDDMRNAELLITKVEYYRLATSIYLASCKGILNAIDYVTDRRLRITDSLSSYEAISLVASDHFVVESNRSSVEDAMNWIQPNITDKKFVDQMWERSYVADTFPAIAITAEKKFLIKDLRLLSSQSSLEDNLAWRFTTFDIQNTGTILVDEPPIYMEQSGFINNLFGYGKRQIVNNLEEGTFTSLAVEPEEPFLSQGKLLRSANADLRQTQHALNSENVHANFQEAKLQNVINLGVFGSVVVSLKFSGIYKPVNLLDVVQLRDDTTVPSRVFSSEYFSGLYIVTGVTRALISKSLITFVELSRESLSAGRGEFK